MTKKFVISVENLSQAEEVRLSAHMQKMGSWWHWINGLWLLRTDEEITPGEIRDKIKEVNSGVQCIVLQVEGSTWAARGFKSKEGAEMRDWIDANWTAQIRK